jgi:PAS domain-containing protein
MPDSSRRNASGRERRPAERSGRRRDSPQAAIARLRRALDAIPAEMKNPELTLRQRAEALSTYLSQLPLAVLVANDRGIDANEAAARLTGYSRPELLRLSLAELTPVAARSRRAGPVASVPDRHQVPIG